MKFYCIADETTVRGFRLGGVDGQVANSATEAVTAVRQAIARPDSGVIILSERVADSIGPLLDEIRFERDRPLVVVIPGPDGPAHKRKTLGQLVQQAIGIRLEPEKEI